MIWFGLGDASLHGLLLIWLKTSAYNGLNSFSFLNDSLDSIFGIACISTEDNVVDYVMLKCKV